MSSHDSICIVLKCMLKGAADFLIKPVRRNELRNLWQHVWRRQSVYIDPSTLPFAIIVEFFLFLGPNSADNFNETYFLLLFISCLVDTFLKIH